MSTLVAHSAYLTTRSVRSMLRQQYYLIVNRKNTEVTLKLVATGR